MSFSHIKETINEGDTVILYVGVSHIYALEVKPKILNRKNQEVENVFQTQYGCLKVMDLVGQKFGSKVSLSKGWAHVLYPTPELWTITLPHRTQILYTPDISMIVMELDIGPGSVVCEAGTGSGSLSHAILRAIGPTGHLYTSDFHQNRVDLAAEEFQRHGHGSRVTVGCRDICEQGWGLEDKVDAAFMDLPNPWKALPHAITAIKNTGGRICSFSPCIEQVMKTCELMQELGLTEINTIECLQREFQVRTITCSSIPVLAKTPMEEIIDQDTNSSNDEKSPKKVKIEETDLNNGNNKSSDTETNKDELPQQLHSDSHKFKTAIPLLKMPGHTGYLTFATIPPDLPRNFSKLLEANSIEDQSNGTDVEMKQEINTTEKDT